MIFPATTFGLSPIDAAISSQSAPAFQSVVFGCPAATCERGECIPTYDSWHCLSSGSEDRSSFLRLETKTIHQLLPELARTEAK